MPSSRPLPPPSYAASQPEPTSPSSPSRALFVVDDEDGHDTNGNPLPADCQMRASFQGGPPPGAFMLGPPSQEHHHDETASPPPQRQYQHQQPLPQEPYHHYVSASPMSLPYSPADYDFPESLASSPPHDAAALAETGFSWPAPHGSPPPFHHHHYQYHHYYHPHWPPETTRAAGALHPSLSQSTRGSRDSCATPELVSDATSLAPAEFTPHVFDDVVDSMDAGTFSGGNGLFPIDAPVKRSDTGSRTTRSSLTSYSRHGTWSIGSSATANWLSKLHGYANSRLPLSLTPLHLYMPTWPLLCLAAQFSRRAYAKPAAAERETHVEADAQDCPRAMVIKSVALDHMNLIVFAVRGSTLSFRDWATNTDTEPASPAGFLDDAGNLCHAGFLAVAKQMVKPVATRLYQLLDENPARGSCSLIITGHSAGGAVASLLYAHMLSQTLESELIDLRDRFKRVHCVSFGAPPLSLLPLDKPSDSKFDKWLFFSFINEGDPVVRAERAYIRSLLELYNAAPPQEHPAVSGLPLKLPFRSGSQNSRNTHKTHASKISSSSRSRPVWKVPPPTLSLPGRLIVLRQKIGSRSKENDREKEKKEKEKEKDKDNVEALLTSNEDLVDVVFGDLLMHPMKLYERRVQVLATEAVTAKGAE